MSEIRPIEVFGVGNALVDLQVEVDGGFLTGLEVEKGRMALVEPDRQQAVLKALSTHSVNRCSGGSAANTIAGIADLGGAAAYCGRVGDDDLGVFYRADLRELGVELHGELSSGTTGTSCILITPDAQRTMLTSLGCSSELGPEDVTAAAMKGASYVYVEGYLFTGESTTAAAMKTIELAKEQGIKVALTVSDPFVIDMKRDLFWELIEGPVDLLFCNEDEAKSLTKKDDPIECAKALHDHAENVALTLGANGSILMHDGEVHPIEGVPCEAVDTTGAGDMYAAGILHGITAGYSWPEAGRLASHAAARVVAQLGARLPGRFTPDEIDELVKG
jgi:sugar/nucleoside kinase (ribokinase family)